MIATCPAYGETIRIVPGIAVTETHSDNPSLAPDMPAQPAPDGGTLPPGAVVKSGWVTDVSPNLRIDLTGTRAKGFLDFQFHDLTYSSDSRLNSRQKYVNSAATVEAAEGWFFIDARANITQQSASAFGSATAPDQSSASQNRVETTAYQLAPYIKGRFGDAAMYQLRFNGTQASADSALLPTTRAGEWVAKLGSALPSARLGWALDANSLEVRNDVIGKLEDSRIRGSMIFAYNSQFRVIAIAGAETTDFAGPPRRTSDTPGVGLQWSPSERTQLAGIYERRFFGDGHIVTFGHRTPLTAWRVSSVKDVSVLSTQLTTSDTGSIQNLMADLLASTILDPREREEAARRRIEATGLSGNSALSGTYATTRPFVYRSDNASVAFLGSLNTLTLTVSRQEQRAIGTDLGGEVVPLNEDVRRTGLDANWSRKLSPLTYVTFSATSLRTEDLSGLLQDTRQKSYNIFIATRLGPKTAVSFGLRRNQFDTDSPLTSYRENAVFGSLSVKL